MTQILDITRYQSYRLRIGREVRVLKKINSDIQIQKLFLFQTIMEHLYSRSTNFQLKRGKQYSQKLHDLSDVTRHYSQFSSIRTKWCSHSVRGAGEKTQRSIKEQRTSEQQSEDTSTEQPERSSAQSHTMHTDPSCKKMPIEWCIYSYFVYFLSPTVAGQCRFTQFERISKLYMENNLIRGIL